MLIRSRVNRNVLDVSEDEGRHLLSIGQPDVPLFEPYEPPVAVETPVPEPAAPVAQPPTVRRSRKRAT